jgi:hypothetical protein
MRFSSDFYQIFVRYEIKWHTHQRGQKASDKPEKEEEAGADRRVYCDVERSFFCVISTAKKQAGDFDVKQPVEGVVMSKIHPALECLSCKLTPR